MGCFFEKIKILPAVFMNKHASKGEMQQKQWSVVGVMSGTSLDGIDLTYTTFTKDAHWSFELHCSQTIPYSDNWIKRLQSLTSLTPTALDQVNADYIELLVGVIQTFISAHQIENIDAICSHGHTALHRPEQGITYQIGNHPDLAKRLKRLVVCDFRKSDVALGGQGAPLVPIGDRLLFSAYDGCLNLGGFANLTYNTPNRFVAFDVGGFNLIFNRLARHLDMAYDDQGRIARSGKLLVKLYTDLQILPYYTKPGPKSLGIEWLEKEVYPLLDYALENEASIADIMHTYSYHITTQLANQLVTCKKLLCTGGGAYNTYALELLQRKTRVKLHIPPKEIVEFKESLVFGFLGVLRLLGQPNCYSSITGSSIDHSSGAIYFP